MNSMRAIKLRRLFVSVLIKHESWDFSRKQGLQQSLQEFPDKGIDDTNNSPQYGSPGTQTGNVLCKLTVDYNDRFTIG